MDTDYISMTKITSQLLLILLLASYLRKLFDAIIKIKHYIRLFIVADPLSDYYCQWLIKKVYYRKFVYTTIFKNGFL